ncbi:MAG: leucine-rich repeat domain-containing protein [Saprospiraceae bacterium]|nr:leucine-rich repeat domain-containing protein [Saprospiraceae bacterium]
MHYLFLLLTWWGINVGMYSNTINPIQSNRASDSLALVKLYQSTNGLQWLVRWNLAQPIHTWYGVELDANGCVIALRLQGLNLDGTLPVELANLSHLQLLYLYDNKLTGPIPGNIGFLNQLLDLNIEANQLTGEIPPSIKNITGLRYLTLSNNQLTGEFPGSVLSLFFLQDLILAGNQFYGPLPEQLSSMTSLRVLDLSNNQFSGVIPIGLSAITNLRELYLSNNQFRGNISPAFSALTNLQSVWLNNNHFTGMVPDWTNAPLISLRIEENNFSSIPDYSLVRSWGNVPPFGLDIKNNLFSFEDLIPLLNMPRNVYFEFNPQKPIPLDSILYVTAGTNYAIRLNVDGNVPDNNYKWIKDDEDLTITDQNFYQIINASEIDEGYYSGSVRNDRFNNFEIEIGRSRVVVFEAGRCNQPLAGRQCADAPVLCSTRNLHDYCGLLFSGQRDTSRLYYCDSSLSLQNSSHLLFIATHDTIVLEVFPRNCNVVEDSTGRYEGIQMLIQEDCLDQAPLYCQSQCSNQPFTIGGGGFVKGKTYQIIIDGCRGNTCEFLIKVIQGKTDLQLNQNGAINGAKAYCPDGNDHFYTAPIVFGASHYLWFVNDSLYKYSTDTFINLKNLSSGLYRLKMRAANACDTTADLSYDFEVLPKMLADSLSFSKIGNDSAYSVRFYIRSGTPPYKIKSGMGSIDTTSFGYSSPFQNCKSNYFIEIEDSKSCLLTVSGNHDCGCTGLAGDMRLDTLRICEGQNVDVQGIGNQIMGPGDVLVYIIYSNPEQPIGSLIRFAQNGVFPFDPSRYKFDTPYYVSQVITKNNTQGQVNLRHPCLSYSAPQVVYFIPRPILSAGGNKVFCGMDGVLSSTGNIIQNTWRKVSGPGPIRFSHPDSNWTQISVDSMGLFVVELKGRTEFCERTILINVRFQNQLMPEIGGFKFHCTGQSTTLDAGENYSSYLWSTGHTGRMLTVNGPGIYCVSVTDANNCFGSSCVEVESSSAPFVEITGPQSLCQGRDTFISSNADFMSYQWSTGETSKSIRIDTGKQYCLIVQADNGCRDTACIQISNVPSSMRFLSDSACFGFDYPYLGGTYKTPGIHFIKLPVPNRFGCDSIVRLTLNSFPVMFVSDTLIRPDNGTANGSISVVIKGGKEPYRYSWSHGANTSVVNNLSGGNYTLTVRDANNCIQIFSFVVRMNVGSEDLNLLSKIKIFPNPNHSQTGFHFLNTQFHKSLLLQIFHSDGSLLFKNRLNDLHQEQAVWVDWQGPPGIYFVQFNDTQGNRHVIKYAVFN